MNKMSTEEDEEETDEILERLNRQLEEEKRESLWRDEIDKVVEERLKETKKTETRPAVFEDKKKKKRQVAIKRDKEYKCMFCGTTNTKKADDDMGYIMKIRGALTEYEHVFHCTGCGKRQGVIK